MVFPSSVISRNERPAQGLKDNVYRRYVFVDGLGVGDVSNIVLRDRKQMAEDGMIVAIATLSSETGELVHSPDIISRGFVYMKENKDLIEKTRDKTRKLAKQHNPKIVGFAGCY